MNVLIIGNPNVGKSMVLNRLTGGNLVVSNYSGTSIQITEARLILLQEQISLYDTPGIYSLLSPGQEQDSIKEFMANNPVDLILNIVDATNLERNLVLTFELIEMSIPVIVLANQIDRARQMGMDINKEKLQSVTGCPGVLFSADSGEGIMELLSILKNPGDRVSSISEQTCSGDCRACFMTSSSCLSAEDVSRAEKARHTADLVIEHFSHRQKLWLDKVQSILDSPFLGTLLLLGIAYLCFAVLLQFIHVSENHISILLKPVNIFIAQFLLELLPSGLVSTIIAKAVPEGIVVPFTIIMPAMLMVGFIMSVLEDTGLLPRYSVALERAGRLFGISGQAVIPLSLGLGCRTPAVLATRMLPNMAEKFIVITLLSIVIPCAATLGVMAAVISAFNASLPILLGTMLTTLFGLGFGISRMMPREEAFVYEMPPLRIPRMGNIWYKVKFRFSGFFTEVLPLLLVMNIIIRALMESGFFEIFESLDGITRLFFGIPAEAFVAVLVTIFQRYLAPLVLLNIHLSPREATIAIAMIALSLPCLPVMVMTVREIGMKGLAKILALGLTTSFVVGIILNLILPR